MHVQFTTALVVTALIAAVVLVLDRGDRLFPILALIACGIEALLVFHVIELSSNKFRIDVILAALMAVAGGVCWARSGGKSAVTAATLVTLVGVIQLLYGLHFLT
jgi:hypothetical protein